jgi:phenylacetate-CoA ligase
MPLIRYEIGDYAIPGGPCRCGRGLPVLKRIQGRQRNMMILPDGSSFWPSFGTRRFRQLAPVSQHQFVQHAPSRLEVRLVTERPLTGPEEEALRRHIQSRLPVPVEIAFAYVDEIARSAGGKYEDLICLVDGGD